MTIQNYEKTFDKIIQINKEQQSILSNNNDFKCPKCRIHYKYKTRTDRFVCPKCGLCVRGSLCQQPVKIYHEYHRVYTFRKSIRKYCQNIPENLEKKMIRIYIGFLDYTNSSLLYNPHVLMIKNILIYLKKYEYINRKSKKINPEKLNHILKTYQDFFNHFDKYQKKYIHITQKNSDNKQ